jgi:hypothetical protein
MSYRNDARKALERAKAELAGNDDQRLKYAALELRMAMESITYDRALAYKEEFPEKEYDTWQPKKVMAVLLEIDANADKDSSLAIGKEPAAGVPAPVMHSLGTEKVLNMATIKEHYDALGSYLHVQTVKQLKKGVKVDFAKVRQRCETIAGYLTEILASPVWNSTFGNFASFDCGECGAHVRRRLRFDGADTVAECECGAKYDVKDVGDGTVQSHLQQTEVHCPNKECGEVAWVPRHLVKPGLWWKCVGCGSDVHIHLGVSLKDPDPEVEMPN